MDYNRSKLFLNIKSHKVVTQSEFSMSTLLKILIGKIIDWTMANSMANS